MSWYWMRNSCEFSVPDRTDTLKICLASRAPFVGGAEVAAERLATGLRDAGHEVFLLLGRHGEVRDRLEQAGLRCVVSPLYLDDKWKALRNFKARRVLRGILQTERPHVIHSNDLPTHQMVSGVACRLGIPRVCHHRFVYDGATIDWYNKHSAELHIFISNALRHDLCSASLPLAASHGALVYDGLPLPAIPTMECRNRARADLRLPLDKFIVLFAGQVIPIKGVADLLHAWASMGSDWHKRAELVLIGDDLQSNGAYRREMEALALQLNCQARFAGFQTNVSTWLTAADIAVVPSHVEPLSLATLEAMAHELPVIGCAVGGIREIILPGETGLLVPPKSPADLANALSILLMDSAVRQRLGRGGRIRCEQQFSIAVHVQSILEQYRTVLSRCARVAS
jgi:glycosyltransferase involved in cell wall biosynthesis